MNGILRLAFPHAFLVSVAVGAVPFPLSLPLIHPAHHAHFPTWRVSHQSGKRPSPPPPHTLSLFSFHQEFREKKRTGSVCGLLPFPAVPLPALLLPLAHVTDEACFLLALPPHTTHCHTCTPRLCLMSHVMSLSHSSDVFRKTRQNRHLTTSTKSIYLSYQTRQAGRHFTHTGSLPYPPPTFTDMALP